jgi:RecB family exonuclease
MSRDIKISATRINMFLQCKQKYWFNYYDNLPKITNPAFKVGLVCHETLEFAGRIWMEKEEMGVEKGFTEQEKEEILNIYDSASVREGIDSLEAHKEGKELVKRRLNNFEIGRKIISLEEEFGMGDNDVFTDDGVPLIGAIDRVEEIDEDSLMIIDYKTSKTAPTGDQLRNDIQLSIYDLVASIKWPEYKRIILCLDLLKSDFYYTYRSEEERAEFSKYLKALYDEMNALKKKDVKPELNIFCAWCDYKDYCKAYRKACQRIDYDFSVLKDCSDEELVHEWNKIRSVKKILEGRERELSMSIIEKIRRKGINLTGNEGEVYIRQNSRTTYDLKTVYDLVPIESFLNMINLNKKAVEKYIDSNSIVKEKIMKTSRSNYTSPFLALKKGKGNHEDRED